MTEASVPDGDVRAAAGWRAEIDADLAAGEYLQAYDAARLREWRGLTRLTRTVLWGIRHRWLARWVVRNLARRPQAFEQVLAVGVGEVPLTRFGVRNAVGVLAGV